MSKKRVAILSNLLTPSASYDITTSLTPQTDYLVVDETLSFALFKSMFDKIPKGCKVVTTSWVQTAATGDWGTSEVRTRARAAGGGAERRPEEARFQDTTTGRR